MSYRNSAPCGCFEIDAAQSEFCEIDTQCGFCEIDAQYGFCEIDAQYGFFEIDAQCGFFEIDAAQYGYTHLRPAHSGYNVNLTHSGSKNKLARCGYKEKLSQYQQYLIYIKSKYWLLEKKQKSSFEKKLQPLTMNNKFNCFIFLSDNMALYFIDDDLVKKLLHIAFIL